MIAVVDMLASATVVHHVTGKARPSGTHRQVEDVRAVLLRAFSVLLARLRLRGEILG